MSNKVIVLSHTRLGLTCPLLLICLIVSLQAAVVAVQADVEAVGEVAGLPQVLQQVHAVPPAAVAATHCKQVAHK